MTNTMLSKISRHKVANAGLQFCPIDDRIYPCNHINCTCGAPLRAIVPTPNTPEYFPAGN
jgi:hypothetical protein